MKGQQCGDQGGDKFPSHSFTLFVLPGGEPKSYDGISRAMGEAGFSFRRLC